MRFPRPPAITAILTSIALLVANPELAAAQEASAIELLKGYRKLDTAQSSRDAFLGTLGGTSIEWGRWWLLAPFPHPLGGKDIATAYGPEHELPAMTAGSTGPDLARKFPITSGTDRIEQITWMELPDAASSASSAGARIIDLGKVINDLTITNKVGYLYRQVISPAASQVVVSVGSDDGMRLWLNGALVSDVNAERPLDPDSAKITIRLKPGINHILVKVSQGAGQWQFAFTPTFELDTRVESALDWRITEDFPQPQDHAYRTLTIPVPKNIAAEIGGVDVIPDGRLAVCTRRGDVYLISGWDAVPPVDATWRLFASGLQEPLGIVSRPDPAAPGKVSLVLAQRAELTRLTDSDGDGDADAILTLCDRWEISGNYHEYAFGPVFDPQGNAYINLNLAHTGGETVMGATIPTRGCVVKIAADGTLSRYADGLRSPDGIGFGPDGTLFFTDNQGDYVATNKLSAVLAGSFHGHQASLKFRDGYGPTWKADGKPVPEVTWPAVWFPYQKMGQSACGFVSCATAGKFGPFDGQMFVGDQTHCTISRVTLEKLPTPSGGALYQGACYPFRAELLSGVHRLAFAPDGSLIAGMTDRGWGSTGPKRFGLQRIIPTGRASFEILDMTARHDGFRLRFTKDLAADAADPAKYRVTSYTYEYHPDYGSSEMETRTLNITAARLGDDLRTIDLTVDGLRDGGMGFVHELRISGLLAAPAESSTREPLLHPEAYYTLHIIPDAP